MVKISIIMAAFNEERNIRPAVESILVQTFADFELIIINDGSTDNTRSAIESYTDPRIRLLNKANSGLADSLNVGLRCAHGELIARLDADDQAQPDRLMRQREYLVGHEDVGLLGSWARMKNMRTGSEIRFCPPTDDRTLRAYLQRDNPFVHSSIMMRRLVLDKVGGYSLIHPGEDYDLWIRIATKCRVAILPEFLVTRCDNHNFTNRAYYKGLDMSAMFRSRLSNQLKAARELGWSWQAPLFLTKTLGQLLLSQMRGR